MAVVRRVHRRAECFHFAGCRIVAAPRTCRGGTAGTGCVDSRNCRRSRSCPASCHSALREPDEPENRSKRGTGRKEAVPQYVDDTRPAGHLDSLIASINRIGATGVFRNAAVGAGGRPMVDIRDRS